MRKGDTHRRVNLVRWFAGIVGLTLTAASVLAAEVQSFSLPAGDAAQSVQALARQSGLQVFAPNADLRGVGTNAVEGEYAPIEALRLMLQGTGLVIAQTDRNTATIVRSRGEQTVAQASQPDAQAEESASVVEAPEADGDDDDVLDTIVVTGSRIRRPGFDTLQAATIVDSEEIAVRGYTNIADALENTPGFGVSDSSPVGVNQPTLGIAQSFVNFFGLGSQRTLTLVNGRRFVGSNPGTATSNGASPGSQVDLNLIPASLVERVETVSIGGAPVYGSDAIAGTVNIILKDNFEGVDAHVQYGGSEEGGDESWNYRLTLGGNFDGDRGNVVLNAEYFDQEGLLLSDRFTYYGPYPNPADTGPNDGIAARRFIGDERFAFMTEGGLPFDNQLGAGDVPGLAVGPYARPNYVYDGDTPLQFDPNGNLVRFALGDEVLAGLGGGAPFFTRGGDGVNFADHNVLRSPVKRVLLNSNAHYDLTPWVSVFLEGSYAHTESREESEFLHYAAPNAFGGPLLTFSVDNPFLTDQARSVLMANGLSDSDSDGVADFTMYRNLNDVTDFDSAASALDVFRIVAGFEGDLQFGDQAWTWDASYNYGRSQNISDVPYIDPDRLLLAIDAVDDGSGNIVCASGGNCVPINLFGVNNFSREAVDYIIDRGQGTTTAVQQVFTANLGGPFAIGLPNPISFNIGYEHRMEELQFVVNSTLEGGIPFYGGANGYVGSRGEFRTDEFYGELLIPVIAEDQNLPLIRALSVEGAARYVDNSIAGGDTTWSAGGRLSPRLGEWSEGLVFRGVFTHAIRAPAINELFQGTTGFLDGVNDPCDQFNYNKGLNPQVREANCAAALTAAGALPPGSFDTTVDTVSPTGVSTGNLNLENEVADSWSVGAVYQPSYLPNFRMSVDWSDISLEQGIENLGITSLLAACYDSPNYPNEASCTAFSRLTAAQAAAQPGFPREAGEIANGFVTGYINASSLDFSGLIANAAYSFAAGAGDITASATLHYVDKFISVLQPGTPVVNAVGLLGQPRFRGNFSAGYAREVYNRDVEMSIQALWTDDVTTSSTATPEDVPAEALFVKDYWLFNATLATEVVDGVQAQVVVNNLFDRQPPFGAQAARSYGAYGSFGRNFFLRLSGSF